MDLLAPLMAARLEALRRLGDDFNSVLIFFRNLRNLYLGSDSFYCSLRLGDVLFFSSNERFLEYPFQTETDATIIVRMIDFDKVKSAIKPHTSLSSQRRAALEGCQNLAGNDHHPILFVNKSQEVKTVMTSGGSGTEIKSVIVYFRCPEEALQLLNEEYELDQRRIVGFHQSKRARSENRNESHEVTTQSVVPAKNHNLINSYLSTAQVEDESIIAILASSQNAP
jgi:hypothetical protein